MGRRETRERRARYNGAAMPDCYALQARLVFPVAAPPLAGACVSVVDGRIVAVGAAAPGCAVHDLGNVSILPGFVNAHTHLEFSDIRAPLGEPGMPLVDWIRLVMAHRRASDTSSAESVANGLCECVRSGTTTLGDIATHDWRAAISGTPAPLPETIVFRECIAPTDERIKGATADAEKFLTAVPGAEATQLRPALSPHAPYSIHRRLLVTLVELARRFDVPLAMHLAESREELELLRSGSGPFYDLLLDLEAWNPDSQARYSTVLGYLHALSLSPRALVIHGNYLSESELDFLAAHADSMSVVYCPRTHAYFRHDAYPLARMLKLGVAVALGTDSRASNPDLDMAAEMRFVAQRHPELPVGKALELATLSGARALGVADRVGSLTPGKAANLAIVRLSDRATGDPYEAVLAPAARVVQTWIGGQLAFDAERSDAALQGEIQRRITSSGSALSHPLDRAAFQKEARRRRGETGA